MSLVIPPLPGAGPSRPACSLFPSEQGEERNEPPLHQFERGGLHELKPFSYRDGPSAFAFALAVIAEKMARAESASRLVLWCLTQKAAQEWGHPYGPGLSEFGLDPALFLIVQARNDLDAAWALEEGLKSGVLLAALGQVEVGAPLIGRRLGLAAQGARTPCLLLTNHNDSGLPGTLTRWRIASSRSQGSPFDASAPGALSLRLTLERCRGDSAERSWKVEWSRESHRFRLAAAFSHRTPQTGESHPQRPVHTG
ncbi:MAG: ImuA family protein [Methyloceanibacter sp.]